MDFEFQVIDYESPYYAKVLKLREDVLRKPIGLSLSEEDTMEDKDQYIVIAASQGAVLGCLMLKIVDADTIKFRQMAVLPAHQNSKIGTMLLHYAENFCLLNDYHNIELHARLPVHGFYKKNGFTAVGEEFEEVGIGHIKMVKDLRLG